jgi:hypothetical protein
MTRKRIAQLLILIAGLFVFLMLSRHWPKDRTFRVVLGEAAARVDELSIRYDDAKAQKQGDGEPLRVTTFHYGDAGAPRTVTHEARLADGDYTVEIEVASHSVLTTVRRSVTVEGDSTTTIDISRELAKELARTDSEAVPR